MDEAEQITNDYNELFKGGRTITEEVVNPSVYNMTVYVLVAIYRSGERLVNVYLDHKQAKIDKVMIKRKENKQLIDISIYTRKCIPPLLSHWI